MVHLRRGSGSTGPASERACSSQTLKCSHWPRAGSSLNDLTKYQNDGNYKLVPPTCSALNSVGVGGVCATDAQCLRGGGCRQAEDIYYYDSILQKEVKITLTKCACPSALSGNINATGGAACIANGTVPLAGGCSASAQCVSGSYCSSNRCCALGQAWDATQAACSSSLPSNSSALGGVCNKDSHCLAGLGYTCNSTTFTCACSPGV